MLSLGTHLALVVGLTLVTVVVPEHEAFLTLITNPAVDDDPLAVSDEFNYANVADAAIGSTAAGDSEAMSALAPNLAMTAATPTEFPVDDSRQITERIQIQEEIRVATGPKFSENLVTKGVAGVGATGATGAIDRLTQEILLSLEERKTLVVWLFDQSGSLERQRAEIIKRFDRIYEELGVIEAAAIRPSRSTTTNRC